METHRHYAENKKIASVILNIRIKSFQIEKKTVMYTYVDLLRRCFHRKMRDICEEPQMLL